MRRFASQFSNFSDVGASHRRHTELKEGNLQALSSRIFSSRNSLLFFNRSIAER